MPNQKGQRQQKVESAIRHQSTRFQPRFDRYKEARKKNQKIRGNYKNHSMMCLQNEMNAGHITQAQLICEENCLV
jgi:hypothetical protein